MSPAARTRVLILSGFRIFPVGNGAQVRTGGIARALARMGYDVHLYSLAGRRSDYRARSADRCRVDQIETNLVEETNLGLGFGVAQAIMRRIEVHRSWQIPVLRAGLLPARLKNELARADVVISDMIYCPPPRRLMGSKPWYMISHQLEHRLLAQGTIGQRSVAGYVGRVERCVGRLFTDVLPVSEEDQAFFRAHDASGHLRAPIVRCGVDARLYERNEADRRRVRGELGLDEQDWLLVFSGSAYQPNLDARARLEAFARANEHFLRQQRVRILLLGTMVAEPYRSGALVATGRVPDVLPYFSAADVGLNPIESGAGANVKLFEYLAARLPVISTAFGVRGSSLEAPRDYVELRGDDFRDAIARLVRGGDQAHWRRFANDVWLRHEGACDINAMVKAALSSLPGFPPP